MKKQPKYIAFLMTSILALGCADYDIKSDGVYFESWNEAHGSTETLIKEADKKTFKKIADLYAKDKNYVFYKSEMIPGADPETFKIIKGGYTIDKHRIYYYGDSVRNSSSIGFEILDPYFSKDNQDIYYQTKPLGVKNLENFKFLTNNNLNKRWSTDGNSYWFNNFKVPSENYDDIVLLDKDAGFSRDNITVYHLDRDLRYNNKGERILDTLDIESFEIEDYIDCRDKFGCINIFHGRMECE